MISEGGLVLFVRVRSEEAERRAEQIMRDQGVEAVRVHEIAIDKRLNDLPLADVIARCSQRPMSYPDRFDLSESVGGGQYQMKGNARAFGEPVCLTSGIKTPSSTASTCKRLWTARAK